MTKELQKVKINDALTLVKNTYKPDSRKYKYFGLEHLDQGGFSYNGYGSSQDVASNKYYFEKGDILLGKLRPYFRKVIKAPFSGICSTDIWVLRANGNFDQNFMYYFVANQEFIDFISRANSGTRMPRADWNFVRNSQWNFPPLPVQKSIAAILSSLDDKIELLREENKTLEAIAQSLFKRWFVDFEFPNEQGKPYKSNGGKMISSELGMIPEGWKVGKLGDEFEITMGQSPVGSSYNTDKNGMVFFQGRAEFGERFPTERLYTTEPKRIARQSDVLISVRAPVGDINVAFGECCIGRGLAAIHNELRSYCLYKILSLKNELGKYNQEGTVFGSINKESFMDIKVVVPVINLQTSFEKKINLLDKRIYNNHGQNQALCSLRDRLLSKLMNRKLFDIL